YNPALSYALGLVYLGDRCVGRPPFVQRFPDSEPPPTVAEIEEIQRRLTALGFDTGGADGRIGNATTVPLQHYQRKLGIEPADGYAGVKLLARLRQGSSASQNAAAQRASEAACALSNDPVGWRPYPCPSQGSCRHSSQALPPKGMPQ